MQGSLPQCWQTETRWELVLQQVPVQKVILLLPIAFASHAADATTFPLPPGSPPFPTQACQERRGKVLGNSLWNLACEAQIYQSNDCACVHTFVPTLPSHQREEREGVSKGCPYSPPSLFLCAHTYACTHTHICLSLEINGLLLRPLIRCCAAGKTCMIPHCAQRLTTESAAPISAVSTENNEGATQGFWNGPVKGQDSLPQHGASWPKDKRVLSLIRVAADKSAFPMCSITATGSEPFQHLYPGCQLWSLLTPIRHQWGQMLPCFFFFWRGDLAAYAAKWLKTEVTWQTHHTTLLGTRRGNRSFRLQGGTARLLPSLGALSSSDTEHFPGQICNA